MMYEVLLRHDSVQDIYIYIALQVLLLALLPLPKSLQLSHEASSLLLVIKVLQWAAKTDKQPKESKSQDPTSHRLRFSLSVPGIVDTEVFGGTTLPMCFAF